MLYMCDYRCGPCRAFTPQLIEAYNRLKANGKKTELIFLSADRDAGAFQSYFATMPWLAVPFEDRDTFLRLQSRFRVQGYPTLLVIDPKDSHVLCDDGRSAVMGMFHVIMFFSSLCVCVFLLLL
jgi:nucleoredoxin